MIPEKDWISIKICFRISFKLPSKSLQKVVANIDNPWVWGLYYYINYKYQTGYYRKRKGDI